MPTSITRAIIATLLAAFLTPGAAHAQSADAALATAKALDAQAKAKTTTPADATALRAKAYFAFADACDRGSREGCAAAADPMGAFLALVLVTSETNREALVARYEDKYQGMVRASCLSGIVADCADYHRNDKGDAGVAAMLDTACGREDRAACAALGRLSATDQRATEQGKSDAQAGCTRGDAAMCYRLGVFNVTEGPGGRDPQKGRDLLARACALHDDKGCLALGQVLISGMGGPADPVRGRQLLTPVCDQGNVDACRMVVRSASDPAGPAPDSALALRIATRLCAARQLDGCLAAMRIDLPGEDATDATIRKLRTMRDADPLLVADCQRNNEESCKMRARVTQQIDQLRAGCAQRPEMTLCRKSAAAGLL